MTARSRKILKYVNQSLYVLSIALLISGMMLSMAVKPVAAAAGTIWTTDATCGTQDQMQYDELEPIYFNYSNITPGTYTWKITPTNDDTAIVASGSFTAVVNATACIYAYTFTVGTAGTYKLTVMDPGGTKVKSDNLKIEPAPVPGITLDKLVISAGPYDSVGDAIAYNFVVTNTGDVALTNVVVSDSGTNSAPVCPSTSLAIGASMTCTGLHSVSQADLDAGSFTNTASADSDQVGPVTDTATVNMAQNRSIAVDKSGPVNGLYPLGATLNYTITVTNTGNVTLPGVTVTDSSAVVGACSPANGSSLAPGASMTCAASHVVTQSDLNAGQYLNTATGTSGQLSGSDSVTVLLTQQPSMSIVKTETSAGPYDEGETITFSVLVTNTGNVTLTYVTVTDPNAVLGSCSPSVPAATLAPGASITCSATHVVSQGNIDSGTYVNTAYGDSDQTLQVQDSKTITFGRAYALSFEKNLVGQGPYAEGDTITYSLELENVGNTTLTNVTIADNAAVVGVCTPAIPVASLVPGGTIVCAATHVVTQADLDLGHFMNTAWGTSTETGPVSDTQDVSFDKAPALAIDKVATAGTYALGNTIPFTITATNTGNVTLHNVTVTDPSAVIDSCSPVSGSSLAPLAAMVCSATHVVTQADVDAGFYSNTSTANSTEAGPVSDTENVPLAQSPNLSIVKSVTSQAVVDYMLGDTLTYSIVLTNTGNVTLHNVTVEDLNADLGSCSPAVPAASLAPLAAITCSASHVITQADLDAGLFENTAVGDSNETDPKQDSETVLFNPGPAISFEKKEVSQGPYVLGDTITYSFELANIGNVTLHNVTISDPKAVIDSCTPAIPVAELAPLAKIVCSASHVVTASDIAAGLTFLNTAVGDSNETDPKNDSVTVTLAIKGCTDPNAENYNAAATIDDGTCTYPDEPTPTPVPTLPIPATGGTVLIPVTGADLSNSFAGGRMPRGLFLGGLSMFGFAMVLSGLRRKMHM